MTWFASLLDPLLDLAYPPVPYCIVLYCMRNDLLDHEEDHWSNYNELLFAPFRYKDSTVIEETERVKLTREEQQTEVIASIVFENCVIEDGGEIEAKATNPAGEDSCVATLNVQSMYPTFCLRKLSSIKYHGSCDDCCYKAQHRC